MTIKINGVAFDPVEGCRYKHDYIKTARLIAEGFEDENGRWDERSVYRALILDDLWFVLNFVMKIPGANHPFVVGAVREVEDGPKDYTLDVWAREHYKSTAITIGETVQWILGHPESSTAIFSATRPLAKKFLSAIKDLFQRERILTACFPDVVFGDCEKESPQWSLDEGLILKRQTHRPEPTLSAWGLVEGMPTGMHFERRVYDDITSEDMAESPDVMEKVKTKFDSSQNLGKEGGHHRVIGTYYHHADPLIYVRNKKNPDGSSAYRLRFKPATLDGTAMGVPVLLSPERIEKLRLTRTFNCQQLLDPSPLAEARLNPEFLKKVERGDIPERAYRVMLIDQAGDAGSNKTKDTDAWAAAVVAVDRRTDDIGQSDVYIEDLWITPASESEAIDQIVRMYLKGGIIQKLGVEKVGISTTHLHIADALRARGRYVSFDEMTDVGVLLRPAGRNKRKFIESSLSWPLNNSKLHYSSAIPVAYVDRLKMEMTNFPWWHDDGLNCLAYLYDVLKDVHFFSCGPDDEDLILEQHSYRPVCGLTGY